MVERIITEQSTILNGLFYVRDLKSSKVWDVKVDWCNNETHKVEDSIVKKKIEFSLKKKYTALTLPTSSCLDELDMNAFQFTASRF